VSSIDLKNGLKDFWTVARSTEVGIIQPLVLKTLIKFFMNVAFSLTLVLSAAGL